MSHKSAKPESGYLASPLSNPYATTEGSIAFASHLDGVQADWDAIQGKGCLTYRLSVEVDVGPQVHAVVIFLALHSDAAKLGPLCRPRSAPAHDPTLAFRSSHASVAAGDS